MRAKTAGKPTMNAAVLTEDVRTAAKELVRRREYHTGSRMRAYEDVADMVGTSAGWLRSFIKGYGDVSLSFATGMNITVLYGQLCERAEFQAWKLEERNEAFTRAVANMGRAPTVEGAAPDVSKG